MTNIIYITECMHDESRSIWCIRYIVCRTMYVVQYTWYNVYGTCYVVQCLWYNVRHMRYGTQYTSYNIHYKYTLYNVRRRLYIVCRTIVIRIVYIVQCTSTLYHTSYNSIYTPISNSFNMMNVMHYYITLLYRCH